MVSNRPQNSTNLAPKHHEFVFDGPKFFTPLRKELYNIKLNSSALAVYILVHFECDPDTGEFNKDVSELARKSDIPRQTIWKGFKELEEQSLIESFGSTYRIVGYETNRLNEGSYFRIPSEFIKTLAICVRHRAEDVLLFGLQLLDQLRTEHAKPQYARKTLKKYLGSFMCRIRTKLGYLADVIQFQTHAGANGETFTFYPMAKLLASEEQVKHRNLAGIVFSKIVRGIRVRSGSNTLQESRLFINTCVRVIVKLCGSMDELPIQRIATLIGIKIAEKREQNDPIRNPKSYLEASIADLIAAIS